MEIGGSRSSLLNLLNSLSHNQELDLHLFIINPEGDLLNHIPSFVNVLPKIKFIAYSLPSRRYRTFFQRAYHFFIVLLNRIFGYNKVSYYLFNIFTSKNSLFKEHFDVVVGYQEGLANLYSSYFITDKYFTWIHSDINKWYNPNTFERLSYLKSKNIIFVADNTRKLFTSVFPEYAEKCIVVRNTIDKDNILKKSKEIIEDDFFQDKTFKILSIGRLTEAKAFDRIIDVVYKLKADSCNIHWYILGDGELKSSLNGMIEKKGLSDCVKMLGLRTNPYPYIKNTDLVVVTSINESQPMVILEALTMSKPVVSTGFNSAYEVLNDGQYGLICDNSTDGVYYAVSKIIKDNDLYNKLINQANSYDYNNDAIITKFIELFN